MAIITFGECNQNMIFPLFGGISKFIVNIILYLIPDKAEVNKHPFLLGINAGFGMSLTIVPYIFILKGLRHLKQEKLSNPEKFIDEAYKKDNPTIKKQKYIIIFFCSFLDFVQKVLVFIFSKSITNNIWIFNIVFLNVFTSMVMKNNLHIHQYLSSGIMVFFGICLNIVNLYNMKKNEIPLLFLSIFIEIIYSLAIVLAKYGMDYRSCSPFEITFYEGIFALILNVMFLIFSTNFPLSENFKYTELLKISEYNGKKYLDNFYTYIENLSFTEVLLFLVTMVGRVLFNLFSHFTIKYYSSCHVVLLLIMGEISLDWKDKKNYEIALTSGIFFIELCMLLVFCEIIELNFCGLEKNTRKNIQERARLIQNDNDTNSRGSSTEMGMISELPSSNNTSFDIY